MASEEKVPDAIADPAIADEQSNENELPVTYEPPLNSPLTGCYLLIILGEPHSQQHKDIILQRLLKGNSNFIRWCCCYSLFCPFASQMTSSHPLSCYYNFTHIKNIYINCPSLSGCKILSGFRKMMHDESVLFLDSFFIVVSTMELKHNEKIYHEKVISTDINE